MQEEEKRPLEPTIVDTLRAALAVATRSCGRALGAASWWTRQSTARLGHSVLGLFWPASDHPLLLRIATLCAMVLPTAVVVTLCMAVPLAHFPRFREIPETKTASRMERIPIIDKDILAQRDSLVMCKAYLQSLAKLARTDSVVLCVNLRDSTVLLHIRGVTVRSCTLSTYRCSAAMASLRRREGLAAWLSTPFTLRDYIATIPKVPIKVKQAPSDTIEAEKMSRRGPRPEGIDDVYCGLLFDRNLWVDLAQSEMPNPADFRDIAGFRTRMRMKRWLDTVESLILRRPPHYLFRIQITIPREDVKAVYRALPASNAAMVLAMPER